MRVASTSVLEFARLFAGGRWIRTIGPATEKLPWSAPCGFRARLRQLGEALIPRGTKSSNPASCSGVPRDVGRGLKNHRLATHDEQGPQRDGEGIFAGRRGNEGVRRWTKPLPR